MHCGDGTLQYGRSANFPFMPATEVVATMAPPDDDLVDEVTAMARLPCLTA
jgi:hypothetical protein